MAILFQGASTRKHLFTHKMLFAYVLFHKNMIPLSTISCNKNLEVHDRRDTHAILIHRLANILIALRKPSQKTRRHHPNTDWHQRTLLFPSQSEHLSKLTTHSRPTDNRAKPRRDPVILGVSPCRIMPLTQFKLHQVRRNLECHSRK